MELGKLADSHRTALGELLDIVVGARHVPVLIVKHRAAEMLNDISRHAHLGEGIGVFLDGCNQNEPGYKKSVRGRIGYVLVSRPVFTNASISLGRMTRKPDIGPREGAFGSHCPVCRLYDQVDCFRPAEEKSRSSECEKRSQKSPADSM